MACSNACVSCCMPFSQHSHLMFHRFTAFSLDAVSERNRWNNIIAGLFCWPVNKAEASKVALLARPSSDFSQSQSPTIAGIELLVKAFVLQGIRGNVCEGKMLNPSKS